MAAQANSSGTFSQSNGKGVFTVADSMDQPRLKRHGRLRRTRMSIRRHLQKHGLAHPDSDSDLEHEECEFCKSACTTQQMHRTRLCQGAWVYFHFKKNKNCLVDFMCRVCVSAKIKDFCSPALKLCCVFILAFSIFTRFWWNRCNLFRLA